MTFLSSFSKFFLFAGIGAVAAFFLGYYYTGTVVGAFKTLFITFVLSILEISLSFDNSIVDATILRRMEPLWQRRFLNWGIFIAVFGMRFIFPLLIVGFVARLNPWDALIIAIKYPDRYAEIMLGAHASIAAFGGTFLMLVALKYFVKENKEIYWIKLIEEPISALGRLETSKIAIALIILCLFSQFQNGQEQYTFLIAGLWGTVAFILVDGLATFLHASLDVSKASMGLFLYLEILDASFSFDGVVGAFAITNQLFIIMIGLGVGAIFMRSLTTMLVKKGTIHQYRYLEHGAFYAMGILSLIMFAGTIQHISEVFTGFIGIIIIALSLWSSIQYNKRTQF